MFFDIAPSEFMLIALVALVVIGPKDLPKVMRTLGYWVGKARGVARQFRSGFDSMVREAELEEMEKRWKAENERILREHPATAAEPEPPLSPAADAAPVMVATPAVSAGHETAPMMVEKPAVVPATAVEDVAAPPADTASS